MDNAHDPLPQPRKYHHTPDMGELSGMGGPYELACQNMLHAGVSWVLDPEVSGRDPDIRLRTVPGAYGLAVLEGEAGKKLERVMLDAVDGNATGAMYEAVSSRILFISQHGWDEYVNGCRRGVQEALAKGDAL